MKEEHVFLLVLVLLLGGVGYLALRSSTPASTSRLVPVASTTYQNNEEWEIVRNGAGYIEKVIIHREAKAS